MSTTTARPRRNRRAILVAIVVIVVLVVTFFTAAALTADVLWYEQLGYLEVLTTRWAAAAGMWVVGFLGLAVPVWLSLFIAFRTRPVYARLSAQLDRYQAAVEPLRRVALWVIPAVIGLFGGFTAAGNWPTVALFFNRADFGTVDPEFGLDLSFYFFELPFYQSLIGFASGAVLVSAILALITLLLYGSIRVSGRQVRISRAARVQLSVTVGLYLLLVAGGLWLERYATLSADSAGFLATGAGYTEVNAVIPGKTILAGAALIVAILCFVTAFVGRWRLPIIGVGLLIVLAVVVGAVYPWIVQRFQVEPNARDLERPYIERSIDATRHSYGVAGVEEVPYSAVTDAEPGALRADAETTANIRILDPAIAPLAFSQLEQFKQYYAFSSHLDVDRYDIAGRTQDTVIAVRELNQAGLGDARSWYNDTIAYTHGYGIVAAFGNHRSADGQPLFLESGIPVSGALGEFEPRVYFGENSPEYSIVGAPAGSDPVEIDYPAGGAESTQTVSTTFAGNGGPSVGNLFTRLVYALKFQSEQILFSDAVNADSQILYDRSPHDRVAKAAPYLTLDSDVYPAVVDGRIVWIVDGYTTSNAAPYSERVDLAAAIADADTAVNPLVFHDVNYVRNSVKATVDAYDGTVTLYAWDPEDPVLQAWQRVFPSTIVSAEEMSAELLAHVRYPVDLFKVQRSILGAYHVTDPVSFYQGDDQWITPTDPVQGGALQPPYYLTMEVPGTGGPAFTLYSTYIPRATSGSSRQILTGYLTATADAGPEYGKLTLLTLPTQTIPGPGQMETTFQTNTEVASQLALLERGETTVRLGNLLTLPVGGGLLYVQPVYVQATSGTIYPLLRKVLVGFGEDIAFEDTLDGALDVLFGGDSGASAGDSGELPEEPTEPVDPDEPEEPSEPSDGTDQAALRRALADYQAALADRIAAYAAGDLVAAAEADQRMVAAIERALAALDG